MKCLVLLISQRYPARRKVRESKNRTGRSKRMINLVMRSQLMLTIQIMNSRKDIRQMILKR